MNIKKNEVTVTPRKHVTPTLLANLASHCGPLAAPCGTIGPSIAQAVLEGKGQAQVSLSNLKLAMDTASGVQGILDNFELSDSTTRKPLLWTLITAYLNEKK